MHRKSTLAAAALAAVVGTGAYATEVAVCTDQGRFVIALDDATAPQHVENFLRYVDMGFYSGTVFHRVVRDFVVQGGGLDRALRGRPTLPPVENESRNGLRNERGTVAAARTQDPNSATSQFFVNLGDNRALDAGEDFGYTVFGRVTEGLSVVEAIGRLPTAASGPLAADVPEPLVVIRSVARLDSAALAALPEDARDAALKQRIMAAAEAADFAQTLEWIDRYHSLCGAEDSELTLIEARAALALERQRRAVFVLENYFETAARDDPAYDAAAELYRTAVPEHTQSPAQLVETNCAQPAAPEIPDGRAAGTEDMVAAQTRVKEFVAAGEVYLKCLAEIIDDEERPATDRNAAIGEHNRMVAAMEQAAADFNGALRAFKSRK